MNQSVFDSLNKLAGPAGEIRNSQRFGQPLPSTTTKKWAEAMENHISAIRKGLSIGEVEALSD